MVENHGGLLHVGATRRKELQMVEESEDDEYEVEEVMDSRVSGRGGGRLEYLVKWKNYPVEESTWEPAENLSNAKREMQKFHKANPSAPRRLVKVRDIEYRRWENHMQIKVPKWLFGWEDGKFERDYLERLHRNWKRWKGDRKLIYEEPDRDGTYVRTYDTPVTSRDAKS